MYFKESDRIVDELPALTATLKVVDEQIFKSRGKLLIRPRLWQRQFDLNINQLETALSKLSEFELLVCVNMVACSNCESLNNPAQTGDRCTICDRALGDAEEVQVFLYTPPYNPDTAVEESDYEPEIWDWSKLDGRQHKTVHEAIKSGFPDRQALEQLLRHELSTNLNDFDDSGGMNDTVFSVVKYFEAKGKVRELVVAAHKAQSSNQALADLAKKI